MDYLRTPLEAVALLLLGVAFDFRASAAPATPAAPGVRYHPSLPAPLFDLFAPILRDSAPGEPLSVPRGEDWPHRAGPPDEEAAIARAFAAAALPPRRPGAKEGTAAYDPGGLLSEVWAGVVVLDSRGPGGTAEGIPAGDETNEVVSKMNPRCSSPLGCGGSDGAVIYYT